MLLENIFLGVGAELSKIQLRGNPGSLYMEIKISEGLGVFRFFSFIPSPERASSSLFQLSIPRFCARVLAAQELPTVRIQKLLHFIDDVRFAYVDEDGVGPEVKDMISFLSGCPELLRKTRIMTMFWLNCLCLDHGKLDLPEVKFGSFAGVGNGPDLSEKVEPVKSILLSFNPGCNNFTDASSITECM